MPVAPERLPGERSAIRPAVTISLPTVGMTQPWGAGGRFGAVLTAMATPFDDDGRLDIGGAVRLAEWLVDQGNEGLVLAGTTGEAPTLSDDEKFKLWSAVAREVDVAVLAGSGTNDTRHSVELTKRAEQAGVEGVLVVTPYYNRPSQAGLELHFGAVAASTGLPVLIYDIPVRTGRRVDRSTILGLARDVPNIVGVKDASGDVASTAELIAAAPGGFEVYCGDDALTLPLLAVGAVGVIGVATHWATPLFARMIELHRKGDGEGAARANAQLMPSYRFETGDQAPNPVPVKAMLAAMGLPGGETRPPMGPRPDEVVASARRLLESLSVA